MAGDMSLNAPRSFRVWQRIGRARPISARDRALPVLVVLSLVVNGCAARVENVLQPLAASASDASRVDMLVATTRRPSEKPGQVYSGERGTAISLNTVVVSVPPDRNRKVGNVQWPSRVPANPEKEFAVLEIDKAGSEGQVPVVSQEQKRETSGRHLCTRLQQHLCRCPLSFRPDRS
jgi:hypothetical protein